MFPQPWRDNVIAAKSLIDDLSLQIARLDAELAAIAGTDPTVKVLVTLPGVGPVLGHTIAGEIGDIARFEAASKLVGYTGLRPRVHQSGSTEWRGSLAKNGPRWLRWAYIEAAVHAAAAPTYRDHYLATRARLGRFRGPKIARIEVARKLVEATWHMLTRGEPFAPAGAPRPLAA